MFDILTFFLTICNEANETIQLLGSDRTDSWSGPQGLLHSPALSFPMVPLHPGWSWLPCFLPAGPLSSTLLKGRGNQHQGGEPVCPSGPSMDGRARLDGRLGKIARLKPVFL